MTIISIPPQNWCPVCEEYHDVAQVVPVIPAEPVDLDYEEMLQTIIGLLVMSYE